MTGGQRKIFVVFKTHFDIGFTGLVEEVLDSYAHDMFPRAIEACRASTRTAPGRRTSWTVPAWPLVHSLEILRGTPVGKDLERAAADGTVAWHALPFSLHTELFGLEDLIRSLSFGRALQNRFGRAAASAKMTDVPGHTWILPTILANAGVRFLHLGCNACSTPPDVPLLFQWEGPDRSRVITMYSRGGYGTSLLPPEGWTLPVWLSLQHTSDNVGPPAADAVDSIREAIHARLPDAEVVFGSLDDFALALTELAPDLPVVRKDLADSWIHGVASMPREVGQLRSIRNRLARTESAMALLEMLGAGPVPTGSTTASVSAAYEKILLFGEHTWGLDTKLALNPKEFGGRVYDKALFRAVLDSGKYDRVRRSWQDKSRLITEAEECVGTLEKHLGAPDQPAPPARAWEVVNHHVWAWSGLVPLGALDRRIRVTHEERGTEVPVVHINGGAWADLRALPALSRTRLTVAELTEGAGGKVSVASKRKAVARAMSDRLSLENGWLRIGVSSSTGGVTSLVDRATGRNWVRKKSGVPFGHYLYDVYSRREIVSYMKSYAYDLEPWYLEDFGKPGYPERPHETFGGKLSHSEVENGDGWASVRLLWRQDPVSVRDLGNAGEVELKLVMLDDKPWLDMEYTLSGKDACPLLEAGHVVMPFSVNAPRYAINKTGCVIDPDTDIARDSNRVLYCCERWLDIEDQDNGMLVIPFDTPLFSLGEPAIEKFDGNADPGEATVYFNLFNTQWGTNFPQWIDGRLTFRFRLIPHKGDWRHARAWEHAAAAVQPPSCRAVAATDVTSDARQGSLLTHPVRGLETVTLKRAADGSGSILRLREPTGHGGKRRLSFRSAALGRSPRLIRCNLLEDELAAVPLQRRGESLAAEIAVRPFEILTLKLKP